MHKQLESLKTQIREHQEIIERSTREHERLEAAVLKAKSTHVEAIQDAERAKEAYTRATIQAPGGPEGSAAHALLRTAKDRVEASLDRLQVLQDALSKSQGCGLAQHQETIASLQRQLWGTIRDMELGSIGEATWETLRRAFAASALTGTYFGALREFAAQHLARQSPNPDEVREMQGSLRKKYKV